MKALYKLKHTYLVNDTLVDIRYGSLRYGELPKDEKTVYANAEEAMQKSCFWIHNKGIFHKKQVVSLAGNYDGILYNNSDVLSVVTSPKVEQEFYYTTQRLIEQLTAAEFLDYCKEHGLSVAKL